MHLNIDSPWIQAGIRLTNLLILNFWIVIGSIPVLTIGTSLIAASSVCLKMSEEREEAEITRAFWKAWKDNLARGILYSAAAALILWAIWMNFQIFQKFESAPLPCLIAGVIGLLLFAMHFLYAFVLEARYENKPFAALLNSRKIAVRFFLRTLGLAGLLAIQYVLFFRTAPFLNYIGLFMAPAIMVYSVSKVAMPIFRILEKDEMAHDGFAIMSR